MPNSNIRINNITEKDTNQSVEVAKLTSIGAADGAVIYVDTVADLQALDTSGLVEGQRIVTAGYYEAGDGGGNDYVVVDGGGGAEDGGSFIDLNGSGLQAKGLFSSGAVSVRQFGALGDGVNDDTIPIEKAIAYAESSLYAKGDFLVSATIEINKFNFSFVGAGEGTLRNPTDNEYSTRIIGDHTSGPVIRISRDNCKLENVLVDATQNRKSSSRKTDRSEINCGVLVEGDDVTAPAREGDVFDTVLRHVKSENQPGDGIVVSSRCYGSLFDNVHTRSNGGHGFVATNGEYISRNNVAIFGNMKILNCTGRFNKGHSFCAGFDSSTDRGFRVVVENSEGLYAANDPSMVQRNADSFYHVDGLLILSGAATGSDDNRDPFKNAGYALMGRGGVLITPRILSSRVPVILAKNENRSSNGWEIKNPFLSDGTDSDHLVEVEPGVTDVTVAFGPQPGEPLISATDRRDIPGLIAIDPIRTVIRRKLEDESGLQIIPEKINNLPVSQTPEFLFDASGAGKMWMVSGRHVQSTEVAGSFVAYVSSGTDNPVVFGLQNSGPNDYSLSVSGTDIEITVGGESLRTTDIYIQQIVAP